MISFLFVVPTLNSYKLLGRLVASLQAQKYEKWRLLFVDGPSSNEHRHWLDQCCSLEPRCDWKLENPSESSIFGAMNTGFSYAKQDEWIFFWGSDDFASNTDVLMDISDYLSRQVAAPDLFIGKGRYFDSSTGVLSRVSTFHKMGRLDSSLFRRSLFLGYSPPHQATLFGPNILKMRVNYDISYRLSADLDFFLRVSRLSSLIVESSSLEIVQMSDGGVSGQYAKKRLLEVFRAYRSSFKALWLFPFVLRYIRRLFIC